MTDVTKGNIIKKFSPTAPKWRIVHCGLNVFGKCCNKKCESHGSCVVVPKEKCTVDFAKDQFDFECPVCECSVKPETIGFFLCKYKIFGKKVDENTNIAVPFGPIIGETNDISGIQYYDPQTNHSVNYIEYVVEITEIIKPNQ